MKNNNYLIEFKLNKQQVISKLYINTELKHANYVAIELKKAMNVEKESKITFEVLTLNALQQCINTLPFLKDKYEEDIKILASTFNGFIDNKLDKSILPKNYKEIIKKFS